MFPRTLTTLLLALAVTFGTQVFMEADAAARPGSILVNSRSDAARSHKGRASTSKSSKSKSSKSSSQRSSSTREVTRSSAQPTGRTRATTSTRTTTTRSAPTRTTTTRTVRSSRPTTTHHHGHRTTRTVHHRPATTTYYRSGYTSHHHSRHYSSHHHTTHHSSHAHVTTTSTARSPRSHGRATTEPYITGGLGISGFQSSAIVDGPALPGIGYNLAIGAKGKLFGGEFGLNGGGYTFDPGTASTDLGLIGLSGDLKIQPSIAFFEPFASVGIGGYVLNDGIINEASAGVGLRLGAGADFRFDNAAIRVSYLFGAYGMGNDEDAYGGDFGARTETLSAGLLFYF